MSRRTIVRINQRIPGSNLELMAYRSATGWSRPSAPSEMGITVVPCAYRITCNCLTVITVLDKEPADIQTSIFSSRSKTKDALKKQARCAWQQAVCLIELLLFKSGKSNDLFPTPFHQSKFNRSGLVCRWVQKCFWVGCLQKTNQSSGQIRRVPN